MNKIFVIMGKSATGKDTIYKELLKKKELSIKPVVPYTTRPIREGEKEGVEYHFVDTVTYKQMKEQKKIIEYRDYNTVHGVWSYFTVNDAQFSGEEDVILINTLEGYEQIVSYFGAEQVIPIYIQVEDGERLSRALYRERQQKQPKYQELCRRFLADDKDFSEERLKKCKITARYDNVDMEQCLKKIEETIRGYHS